MAGKGGGAWKVAYADFVTAMMAFFLVMWICGQDQEVKRAVSYYFADPFGDAQAGSSKRPGAAGALFDGSKTGKVPLSESKLLGHGRNGMPSDDHHGPVTKMVSDWLQGDRESTKYWREQALRHRSSQLGTTSTKEGEQAAVRQLAKQMREEIKREAPNIQNKLFKDIIFEALSEVQWTALAEDLISEMEPKDRPLKRPAKKP